MTNYLPEKATFKKYKCRQIHYSVCIIVATKNRCLYRLRSTAIHDPEWHAFRQAQQPWIYHFWSKKQPKMVNRYRKQTTGILIYQDSFPVFHRWFGILGLCISKQQYDIGERTGKCAVGKDSAKYRYTKQNEVSTNNVASFGIPDQIEF